jgi:hypothetical protein
VSKTPECWESVGISADRSRVYARTLDGSLYAFSTAARDQQLLWRSDVGYGWDSVPSMLVECDGVIYSGGKKGFVVAVDSGTGTMLWRYWVGPTHVPTVTPIDRNQVIVTSLDGTTILVQGDASAGTRSRLPDALVPTDCSLLPPYPNPFNHRMMAEYILPQPQEVRMTVYNLLGEEIYTQPERRVPAGRHPFNWDGKNRLGQDAPSGLYYVQMIAGSEIRRVKALLLR